MKKLLSVLLVLSLALSLGVTAFAEEPETVLTVYTQNGWGEPVPAKSYTAADLAGLAETGRQVYIYNSKEELKAAVATEYVTLDALLKDAGVSFGEEDSLRFDCDDGPYIAWAPTFEELAQRRLDDEGNTVPAAFALRWNRGAPGDSTAAVAAAVLKSGRTRFVCGMTGEETMGNYGLGTRLPAGVVAVTIVSPASAEKPAQN